MNWTGGRLNRYSIGRREATSRAQKAFFARARSRHSGGNAATCTGLGVAQQKYNSLEELPSQAPALLSAAGQVSEGGNITTTGRSRLRSSEMDPPLSSSSSSSHLRVSSSLDTNLKLTKPGLKRSLSEQDGCSSNSDNKYDPRKQQKPVQESQKSRHRRASSSEHRSNKADHLESSSHAAKKRRHLLKRRWSDFPL